MNGPVVVLLAVLIVVPVFLLLLRLDAWMTERQYQRDIRRDETRRYANARAAIARQQATNHTRIGHSRRTDEDA